MDNYSFGGRPVTSINLLLLIGEMEGVYQHLKYMGFEEDIFYNQATAFDFRILERTIHVTFNLR